MGSNKCSLPFLVYMAFTSSVILSLSQLTSFLTSLILLPHLRLKLASPDSRTAEHTDSLCYFFLYVFWELHSDSKISSCLSDIWLGIMLSSESYLSWQMGPILHNSVNEIKQEKQQKSLNSPKQWIIKDCRAPWWSLQEHWCGLQLLNNC